MGIWPSRCLLPPFPELPRACPCPLWLAPSPLSLFISFSQIPLSVLVSPFPAHLASFLFLFSHLSYLLISLWFHLAVSCLLCPSPSFLTVPGQCLAQTLLLGSFPLWFPLPFSYLLSCFLLEILSWCGSSLSTYSGSRAGAASPTLPLKRWGCGPDDSWGLICFFNPWIVMNLRST